MNITSINADKIEQTTVGLWKYVRWGIDKLRELLMALSEIIAKYEDVFPAETVYLILLGLISMFVISKIFYTQNTTIRGRTVEFVVYVLILFLLFKYL